MMYELKNYTKKSIDNNILGDNSWWPLSGVLRCNVSQNFYTKCVFKSRIYELLTVLFCSLIFVQTMPLLWHPIARLHAVQGARGL